MTAGHTLPRLVEIMDRLLAPDGCPWDREQTLDSLRPFLIEETYEVLEAIDLGDSALHCEELGDLLMQIVFQAAIAARRQPGTATSQFDIDKVIAGISNKLVRRHPHVFADAKGVDDASKVLAQWDQIKASEKAAAGASAGRRAGWFASAGSSAENFQPCRQSWF
jgi:MazG family protein